MKLTLRFLTISVVLALLSPTIHADVITTLFASNGGGALGGAVFFDLTVGSNPIEITSLDTNTFETASFNNFQIWLLPGQTSQGNESNGSPWVQVATGSGVGAGLDQPTAVTLSNSIMLTANTLYGVGLVMDPALGHRYTNGNGSNQFYSNSDLSLSLGSAQNVPFTGTTFVPRVWNGSIYYTVHAVPEPSWLAILGLGLVGLMRLRSRR